MTLFSQNGCGAAARTIVHTAATAAETHNGRGSAVILSQSARERRRIAVITARRRHHRRQYEPARKRGDDETRYREARELLQTRDAREREREIRDARASDARRERRPQRASNLSRLPIGTVMAQQMQWIVLRDSDQRETERERDAVHRAKQGGNCGEPGETGARQRQGAQEDGAGAAIGDQQ